MKRKKGCMSYLILFLVAIFTLNYFGIIGFEYFHTKGLVLETIEPNIYYLYTNQGVNEYGQTVESFEIINKSFQTNGTIAMTTLSPSGFPQPGQQVNYTRIKVFFRWPIHKILWLNIVN